MLCQTATLQGLSKILNGKLFTNNTFVQASWSLVDPSVALDSHTHFLSLYVP